jgi:uncharacterized protein YeeX (DUF496 family)
MDGCCRLEESFDKFLDRSHIPDDVEMLKDIVQDLSKKIEDFSKKSLILVETIEYLKSELCTLRRFQYGQRSERLKKKR